MKTTPENEKQINDLFEVVKNLDELNSVIRLKYTIDSFPELPDGHYTDGKHHFDVINGEFHGNVIVLGDFILQLEKNFSNLLT